MRIVAKIALGCALLIAGYALTVVLTDLRTRRDEQFLRAIEATALPCARHVQGAISVFKQQLAAFQDAVVLGEAGGVERALALDGELDAHLAGVGAAAQPSRRDQAERLRSAARAFTGDAAAVYARLARSDADAALPPLAAELTARSERIAADLAQLAEDLRLDLRQAIDERVAGNSAERRVSGLVFVVVLTGSAALMAVFLVDLSRRLGLLTGASARLTSGDYETTVAVGGRDEVGQLARAFEAMRTAVSSRNGALRNFNASLDSLVRARTGELEQRNAELSTEVAERQRAERSLRLVESAIVQIDEGVVIAPAEERPASPPEYVNPGFFRTMRLPRAADLDSGLQALFGAAPMPERLVRAWAAARAGQQQTVEVTLERADRSEGVIEWHVAPLRGADGRVASIVSILRDHTERRREEAQHHQGQKMESIGQLAAGVAHEINTPIQFIGDNLRFLGDAFADLGLVLEAHTQLLAAARAGAPPAATIAAAEAAGQRADLGYLADEIPKAIRQSSEGVTRVAEIVRAMKEFSHPDQGEKRPADLNKAIQTTLIVARNEFKYVADLETDFAADLPAIPCILGEFNQVVLNLVVNAAHAIGDAVAATHGRGTIAIATRFDGTHAEVRVRDTGTGIPERARAHVFDPFFTTKPVGKGTGQGLYIARTVVVKKHGGTITFESTEGLGTTFIVRLPLEPASGLAAVSALHPVMRG